MRLSKIVRLAASKVRQICGAFNANGTDNYLDTGIVPNQDTSSTIWGSLNSLGQNAFECFIGTRGSSGSGNDRYYIGKFDTTGKFILGWNTFKSSTIDIDFGLHKFKIANGQISIDDKVVGGTEGEVLTLPNQSIILYGLKSSVVQDFADFTMYKAEIIHNGSTHVWDFDAKNQLVSYTIDGVAQPSPTIQGTVQSSQWEDSCIDI